MDWLQTKYVSLLSGQLRNFRRINDRTYQFSCPLCGDSSTNKRKARGYIYEKKGTSRYSCHNCGRGFTFHKFLQEVDTYLYSEYQKERITAGLWLPTDRRRNPKVDVPGTDKAPEHIVDEGDPLRFLTRVSDLPPDHYARAYCSERLLPDLTKVYHCPGFYAWSNFIIPGKFKESLTLPKNDHPRLVIPFFDKEGKLFAYQGRAYKDTDVKYITIKIDESKQKVFGLDTVDETQVIYAFEGPIDSMFIPNSIAFAGGGTETLTDFDPKNVVVVFDNEPRSIHTKKKMLKAVASGFGIVVWPKNLREKDVNKMIQRGLSSDTILKIIHENTHRGLSAEAAIADWSRAKYERRRDTEKMG